MLASKSASRQAMLSAAGVSFDTQPASVDERALEAEMCLMTVQGYQGHGSPDRVDALVWALTELVPPSSGARPQVRTI